MAGRSAKGGGPHRIAISGEMTIYKAAELKGILLAPLAKCPEIELDLSGVSEIDSAGLQLLVLTKTEAATHGRTLRFVSHSPAVLEMLDLCNLGGFFGDPVVISSSAS